MKGFRFRKYIPPSVSEKSDFARLLPVFLKLLLITSGDANEALQWLTEADRQYKLTSDNYGIGDFIEDLKRRGYLAEDLQTGKFYVTAKTEQHIRKSALEEIFGRLKKSRRGDHNTLHTGKGDEPTADRRAYSFGDSRNRSP